MRAEAHTLGHCSGGGITRLLGACRAPEAHAAAIHRLHGQRQVVQHDNFLKMLVIWYERTRPFCARWCMGRPAMSAPAKTMRPLSGCSAPDIWWISVVLPAPLGPISAWISPWRTSRLAWSVAVSPPKRLTRSCTCSISSPAPLMLLPLCAAAGWSGHWGPTAPHPAARRPGPVANGSCSGSKILPAAERRWHPARRHTDGPRHPG